MTARAALVKEFLDGKTVTILTCFKRVGLTNAGREIPRMIENPFNVEISRVTMEGKSRHGTPITWTEYRFNPLIEKNKDAIPKMREYLAQHMKEYRPKEKPKPLQSQSDLFAE